MLYLTLLHRPAESPEQRPAFAWQQQIAHELGLKVTLLVDYHAMKDPATVAELQQYADEFGDELGLWFMQMPPSDDGDDGRKEPFLWLYGREEKGKIIRQMLSAFRAAFGRDPLSAGAYHLDAESLQLLKALCPAIKIVVAGCFEEGVRVFHGCNNSWYLFSEGMPWSPWYPSRTHSLRPAVDEADALGVVAVPHLSRDLALSYEGRNDFFATHPANVQRAMTNDGVHSPYMYNLVDQQRLQAKYNDGFAYTHVFVGPAWIAGDPSVQDSDEVTRQLYHDFLTYFVDLRTRGEAVDLHMSAFADWYRENVPIGKPQIAFAKEMLFGSGKHYFWYVDAFCRVLLDPTQGGAIGDLRPYAARIAGHTGVDSNALWYGTYPYLIQSQHRSGNAHHYADGSRTTLLVTRGGETLDLATVRTQVAAVSRDGQGTYVRLTPASLTFADGVTALIQTVYHFAGDGKIMIERRLQALNGGETTLELQEYVKACYGVTEYPADMRGVILAVAGERPQELLFAYRSREIHTPTATAVSAVIPQIQTKIGLQPETPSAAGAALEGYLFSPYFTLTLTDRLRVGEVLRTWLIIERQ